MRQLRYNYTFPTGYVQAFPLIQSSEVLVIQTGAFMFGTYTAGTLDQAGFNQLTMLPSGAAIFNFTNPSQTPTYFYIAIPTINATTNIFYTGGFPVAFTQTTVTFVVNGTSTPYTVYRSEYKQTAVNVEFTLAP